MHRAPGREEIPFHLPPVGQGIAQTTPVPDGPTTCGFEILPDDLAPGGPAVKRDMAQIAEELAVEPLIIKQRVELSIDGDGEGIAVAVRMANQDRVPGQSAAGTGVDGLTHAGEGDAGVALAQHTPPGIGL